MNLLGTLAFLITALALVLALAFVAVSLVRKRIATATKAAGLVLAWLAVYVGILIAVSLTSPEPILDRGQEHCFDEMCFSVQGVAETPTLGTRQASGVFYIVDVKLRNAAGRTAQKPSNPQIWIIDGDRHEYRQMLVGDGDNAGQALGAEQIWTRRINPGDAVEQRVAFDLPADVVAPRLVITEGSGFPTDIIIGDENSLWHAKTTFRLKD